MGEGAFDQFAALAHQPLPPPAADPPAVGAGRGLRLAIVFPVAAPAFALGAVGLITRVPHECASQCRELRRLPLEKIKAPSLSKGAMAG